MFVTRIKTNFDSAHHLYQYNGKCSHLHGHSWSVEMVLVGDRLDESGMLCDFQEMKELLEDAIHGYDHEYLNQIPPFDEISPTAENISRHIFLTLKKSLRNKSFNVKEVTVWESPKASATYRE